MHFKREKKVQVGLHVFKKSFVSCKIKYDISMDNNLQHIFYNKTEDANNI